jgi:uncharacterized protein (TIGR02270 family)
LATRALDVVARLGLSPWRDASLNRLGTGAKRLDLLVARAALVLGERRLAIDALRAQVMAADACAESALDLLMLVLDPAPAHELMRALTNQGAPAHRRVIRGAGLSGQLQYVPWLIDRCNDPLVARLAGESLSNMFGIDLDGEGLTGSKPPPLDGKDPTPLGDSDAPDEDEDLPWPDMAKVQTWWQSNARRFPAGTRYFMGQPLSVHHCIAVLKTGNQRQRALAAMHASFLSPATPIFNVAAPAWRQRRWLARLGQGDSKGGA